MHETDCSIWMQKVAAPQSTRPTPTTDINNHADDQPAEGGAGFAALQPAVTKPASRKTPKGAKYANEIVMVCGIIATLRR